jgi:hypothetical protein
MQCKTGLNSRKGTVGKEKIDDIKACSEAIRQQHTLTLAFEAKIGIKMNHRHPIPLISR